MRQRSRRSSRCPGEVDQEGQAHPTATVAPGHRRRATRPLPAPRVHPELGELTNWWTHYDADTLAAELTDEQFENFLTTADGTLRFADALRAARDGAAERPRLRAL